MEKYEEEPNQGKMTPALMVEKIKAAYPNSGEFARNVFSCADKQWAVEIKEGGEIDANDVIQALAAYHRGWYGNHGSKLEENTTEYSENSGESVYDYEKSIKMYRDVYALGAMVAAIYHGEATLIDDEGHLLPVQELRYL